MRYVFPCDIVLDQEELQATGRKAFNVTFPDVYGANTGGWSWEEAVKMAEDCLGLALGMYVDAGEDIPDPSPLSEGQVPIPVPPVMAAKLAIYKAVRKQGVSIDELADTLQIEKKAVLRLLDPGVPLSSNAVGKRSPRPRLRPSRRRYRQDTGRNYVTPD